MIRLKDVSKFYYNKGVIATGFTKVSAEFKLGEFVIITGESGSGKSTLLNVLSGTDSYEEGEMYINGEETSHYTEIEFEDYRKKYIGNIFQNFNLVNSYNVYQNIELVLLINGYNKKEVKEKIDSILKEVDLYKFRKTKVSKLSGGQKQRVAIARALAKETPIIIADEPTGNLDSRSAASVLELLHRISKDKLVIIVTHNYVQVEKYATRRIKMHDGKIIEDKTFIKNDKKTAPTTSHYQNIKFLNKLRLGLRNTFNIIPKFLLIFLVYLFIALSLLAEYSSFQKAEYDSSRMGYNSYFQNTDDKRIVIQKTNKTYFSEEDYQNITSLNNIDYIVKDDLLLDSSIALTNDETHLYLHGVVKDINRFKDTLDIGRMPDADNEIIITGRKNDYYISNMSNEIINSDLKIQDNYIGTTSEDIYKIVGIKYTTENNGYGQYNFYASSKLLKVVKDISDLYFSSLEIKLSGKNYKTDNWNPYMQITANDKVPLGSAYISTDLQYNCSNFNCRNKTLTITNSNIYYELTRDVNVTKIYTKSSFTNLTGIKDYEMNNGRIYVNREDYNSLFNPNFFQSSVFVKDIKEIENTNLELEELGFKTLLIKDTLANYDDGGVQILRILQLIVTIILIVVMFFISYFIIKIILKSRNIYFTTIRILGASKKVSKQLLDIELLTIANLAYLIIIAFILLNHFQIVNLSYIKDLMTYISIRDYIIIYLILIIMSQLISSKFAKSLFKKSAMKTFNEVV